MKQNIIIHIGCHKTGTTWLQKHFFNEIEGIELHERPRNTDELPECPAGKTMLISDEEISQSMPHEFERKSLSYIHKYKRAYPNAKIIVATRDFDEWLQSSYSQAIKGGWYETWEEYKEKYGDYPTTNFFKAIVQMLWGEENVYSYSFEDFCSDKDKILAEICQFMNVKMPEYRDDGKRENSSIKNIEVYRLVNIMLRTRFLERHLKKQNWKVTYLRMKTLELLGVH